MNGESTTPSPIDAGSRLQVLWDNHVVDAAKTTASLVVHQPEYAGVAMTHDKPWEGDGSDYHCIVPDRTRASGVRNGKSREDTSKPKLQQYTDFCSLLIGTKDHNSDH